MHFLIPCTTICVLLLTHSQLSQLTDNHLFQLHLCFVSLGLQSTYHSCRSTGHTRLMPQSYHFFLSLHYTQCITYQSLDVSRANIYDFQKNLQGGGGKD